MPMRTLGNANVKNSLKHISNAEGDEALEAINNSQSPSPFASAIYAFDLCVNESKWFPEKHEMHGAKLCRLDTVVSMRRKGQGVLRQCKRAPVLSQQDRANASQGTVAYGLPPRNFALPRRSVPESKPTTLSLPHGSPTNRRRAQKQLHLHSRIVCQYLQKTTTFGLWNIFGVL